MALRPKHERPRRCTGALNHRMSLDLFFMRGHHPHLTYGDHAILLFLPQIFARHGPDSSADSLPEGSQLTGE